MYGFADLRWCVQQTLLVFVWLTFYFRLVAQLQVNNYVFERSCLLIILEYSCGHYADKIGYIESGPSPSKAR